MSGRKREQHKAEVKRARIRVLLQDGYSLSAIAKETGYSYPHVKRIAEQERHNQEADPQ